MTSSVTDYLQKHGISPGPKFSEKWALKHWHDWGAIEEQLKLTRANIKNGKDKRIICKILGICLEATCQNKEKLNRERQDLRDEIEGSSVITFCVN